MDAPISASSAAVGHAAPLRAKIAQFESKGGVPVPRGSFGIGAPPVVDRAQQQRRKELYGNRMKPVWVPSVPSVPGRQLQGPRARMRNDDQPHRLRTVRAEDVHGTVTSPPDSPLEDDSSVPDSPSHSNPEAFDEMEPPPLPQKESKGRPDSQRPLRNDDVKQEVAAEQVSPPNSPQKASDSTPGSPSPPTWNPEKMEDPVEDLKPASPPPLPQKDRTGASRFPARTDPEPLEEIEPPSCSEHEARYDLEVPHESAPPSPNESLVPIEKLVEETPALQALEEADGELEDPPESISDPEDHALVDDPSEPEPAQYASSPPSLPSSPLWTIAPDVPTSEPSEPDVELPPPPPSRPDYAQHKKAHSFSAIVHGRVRGPLAAHQPERAREKRLPPTPDLLSPLSPSTDLAALLLDAATLERLLLAGELPADAIRRLSMRKGAPLPPPPAPVPVDSHHPGVEAANEMTLPPLSLVPLRSRLPTSGDTLPLAAGEKSSGKSKFHNPLAFKRKQHKEEGGVAVLRQARTDSDSAWFAESSAPIHFPGWKKLTSTSRLASGGTRKASDAGIHAPQTLIHS